MKKALLVLILLSTSLSAQAIQSQESANGITSVSMPAKVYDKYGSLQGYNKPQSNGTIKTYDKTNSYTGYYKTSGSKTKYYPNKK